MTSVAIYSYSIAALAFLLLTFLLLTSWRGRMHGTALTVASALTVLWSVVVAWQASAHDALWAWTGALEIVRNGAWSVFLLILLGRWQKPDSTLPFRLNPSLLPVAGFYLVFLLVTVAAEWDIGLGESLGVLPSVVARVGMAVLGMLLVEQLYRNKPVQERWAIKFACLGIGGMFAYDFYLYSHAMLFREVDPDIWAARGVINALTVPLLALSMRRAKSWRSPLAVSRRAMFHSAALFGSAIYLLAMGS
ncbi:MAG TPA: PEP-CTERM system histidine kinase PrsK, partial [Telluria sp.]